MICHMVWAPILKILKYMLKNLSKNEEKSLYKVPLKITFLQGTSKTQNPDFGHTTQVSGIIRSVTNSHWKVLEKSFLILAMLKEY